MICGWLESNAPQDDQLKLTKVVHIDAIDLIRTIRGTELCCEIDIMYLL